MPIRIFMVSILTLLTSTAFAAPHPNSEALYKGMAAAGIPALKVNTHSNMLRAIEITCSRELADDQTLFAQCEMSTVDAKQKFVKQGPAAEEMLSAMFSLEIEKGDGGAYTDYMRCTHDSTNTLRPYECFVSTIIECEEGILFCDR